jgi:acyl-CoA dehydrogenase
MSDPELNQIAETVDAIVARAASTERPNEAIMPLLVEAGLRRVAVPASAGGSEGEAAYLTVVLKRLGYHSVSTGLSEDHLAAELLAQHEAEVPDGMLTVASRSDLQVSVVQGRTVATGSCRQVPWARAASHVLAVAASDDSELLVVLPALEGRITFRQNIAGEPRDDLVFDAALPVVIVAGSEAVREFRSRLLLYRSLAMLGAGEHALDLTVTHVTDRAQFGSALSRRQVVQHYIAEMFGAIASARSACDAAMLALAGGASTAVLAAALATRIEVDRMASTVARLSHQLHGAIGFTEEHILHLSTKRLLAWRQDDLAETACAIELSRLVPGFGGPWDVLTAGRATGCPV